MIDEVNWSRSLIWSSSLAIWSDLRGIWLPFPPKLNWNDLDPSKSDPPMLWCICIVPKEPKVQVSYPSLIFWQFPFKKENYLKGGCQSLFSSTHSVVKCEIISFRKNNLFCIEQWKSVFERTQKENCYNQKKKPRIFNS